MGGPAAGTARSRCYKESVVCDHCGCRQGSIAELMDQHDRISELGSEVRIELARGDEPAARDQMLALLTILRPHMAWEEKGLFVRITAQGEFADHIASRSRQNVVTIGRGMDDAVPDDVNRGG